MGFWEGLVGRETPDRRYRFEACLDDQEVLALFQVWDTVNEQVWLGWVLAVNLFENGEGGDRWGQEVTWLQEARDRRVGRYRDWGTVTVAPQVALPFVLEVLPTVAGLPVGPLPPREAAAIALDIALAVALYHDGLFVRNWSGHIVGRQAVAHGNLALQHLYWTGDRPVLSGGGLRAVLTNLQKVELVPVVEEVPPPTRTDDVRAIGLLLAELSGERCPALLAAVQARAIAGDYPHAMDLAAALRGILPRLQPWHQRWRQPVTMLLRTPWWSIPLVALGASGLAGRLVPTLPDRPAIAETPVPREPESRMRPPSQVRLVPSPQI
ncbi:MAG: hypothetical protein HC918_10520, partial [Oscillatoriales cyanobacterium SM2_1_8]|nr:hypothetical protein [Oscillatoriales cyanobacterium SM2_1_8]